MKKFSLALLAFALSMSVIGQTSIEPTRLKHYIGMDAGASSGYGLSYRYQPKQWGIQINTFPAVSPNEYHISVGATVIRSLYQTNKMQFFLYYGNHLLFEKTESSYYYGYDSYANSETYTTKEHQWRTGIGPGFEIYIAKRLSLNGRFGFAYYSKTAYEDWQINADGGIGLHFMF
jgi:hypothetical protein